MAAFDGFFLITGPFPSRSLWDAEDTILQHFSFSLCKGCHKGQGRWPAACSDTQLCLCLSPTAATSQNNPQTLSLES